MEKNLMTRKLAECEKEMQVKKQDPQQNDEKSVSFSTDSKKKSKKWIQSSTHNYVNSVK